MKKPHQHILISLISPQPETQAELSKFCSFFGFITQPFDNLAIWQAHMGQHPFQLLLIDFQGTNQQELIELQENPLPKAVLLLAPKGQSPWAEVVDQCLCPHSAPEELQISLIKWSHQLNSARKLQDYLQNQKDWIHPEQIQQLIQYHRPLALEMLACFEKEGIETLAQIHDFHPPEFAHQALMAHKLKGMAGNLGACALSELCFQIEFFSKERNEKAAHQYQIQLDHLYYASLDQLKKLI